MISRKGQFLKNVSLPYLCCAQRISATGQSGSHRNCSQFKKLLHAITRFWCGVQDLSINCTFICMAGICLKALSQPKVQKLSMHSKVYEFSWSKRALQLSYYMQSYPFGHGNFPRLIGRGESAKTLPEHLEAFIIFSHVRTIRAFSQRN